MKNSPIDGQARKSKQINHISHLKCELVATWRLVAGNTCEIHSPATMLHDYTSATPTREGDLLEQHVDEHFEVLQSISNHFEAL